MRPNNRPAGNILSEEYVGGQVILSGHETPGEGEHKIMDFIRYEKAQPGYDPNTRWAFCGLHRSSLFFILFFWNTLRYQTFLCYKIVFCFPGPLSQLSQFSKDNSAPCDPP